MSVCSTTNADPYEKSLKKPICENTSIKEIFARLDGTSPKESGSAISYANGKYGVSYEYVSAISERSHVGDPIKLCLIAKYVNCPKGDNRGKTYRATNLKTHESWSLGDSQHVCGGA